MQAISPHKQNILYVFGGEEAQGAEIVIERMMHNNLDTANTHLFIAPGKFASDLLQRKVTYKITLQESLRKLNRSRTGKLRFYVKALKNYIQLSYRVHEYITRNKINVIHANTVVPASYLVPALMVYKLFFRQVKWVWSDHDMRYFSTLDSFHSKLCFHLYHRTLVVSKAVKRKYPLSEKVVVLYNGLDIERFNYDGEARAQFRQGLNAGDESILIGIAASINPDKGQAELIRVFNDLSTEYPNLILIMAGRYSSGSPSYQERIQSAIAANNKIVHLGHIEDMANFYNGCDILISNSNKSRSESLGTTIYEAMACESIVVASNTGGTPEIITDGLDGFLFEADTPSALKETLVMVLKKKKDLQKVRLAARQTVCAKFNIKQMAENYNAVINSLYITES